ncbi:MAG: hypothetical protein SWJ54_17855 [Cyanobacteriota bacterium]|nr:hypothetical protein [Cyanobacteriota bacterium]
MTLTQTEPKLYSFDEFINGYPENSPVRYELHDGVILEIPNWIVDYAALGASKFIGNPKKPTFFVCELIDEKYQMTSFTENTVIISPTFPQFNLSA